MTTPPHRQAPRLARGAAWATAGGGLLVFTVLAAVLVPWDWVPGGTLTPAAPHELFTAEQIARAEEYSSARRWLGWSSYLVSLAVSLILGLTPLGARLVRRLVGTRRWWQAVPGAAFAVLAIGRLVTLPFEVPLQGLSLEYGLSNQGWGSWAVDYAKSFGVGWVLTSLVLVGLVGVARRSPRYWFAWAGLLVAVLAFAGSFLYPVLVEPVFNRFRSLPDGPLRSSVFALAKEEGVEVDDVLVADASRRTTTLNAYVSGIGSTRRVVIYDNLLYGVKPEQAKVIVAHELAHAKHNDVAVGTLLAAVGGVVGVSLAALVLDSARVRRRTGVDGPGDATAVPLMLALFAVAGLAVAPVQNAISRAVEVRADRDSIAVTGEGPVFSRMQRELSVHSLSDPTPPRLLQLWFGSHPTSLERAGLPQSLKEAE